MLKVSLACCIAPELTDRNEAALAVERAFLQFWVAIFGCYRSCVFLEKDRVTFDPSVLSSIHENSKSTCKVR